MSENVNTEKRDRRGTLQVVGILITIMGFFLAYSCLMKVEQGHAAVLTQFERPIGEPLVEPGLYFKRPWPMQKAYDFDLRTQIYGSPMMEFRTKDSKNVVVRVFAHWEIKDVTKYRSRVGVTIQEGQAKLALALQNEVKAAIGEVGFDGLIGVQARPDVGVDSKSGVQSSPGVSTVCAKIKDGLNKVVSEQYGIALRALGFDRLELPEGNTKSVFERQRKECERRQAQSLEEAKRLAREIEEKAKLDRNMMLAQAEADASKIRGAAEAEAFKYLEIERKHPELVLFMRKLDALEKTLAKKSTVVLDGRTSPFDLLIEDQKGETK